MESPVATMNIGSEVENARAACRSTHSASRSATAGASARASIAAQANTQDATATIAAMRMVGASISAPCIYAGAE